MNETQKQLTPEQSALTAELVETYDIEPASVLFFDNTPKPFLMYQASSTLCNFLANISCIDVEPVPSVKSDSFTVRCTLTLPDGRVRSDCGVVNINENIDGKTPSDQQIYNLAASRALRYALRSAGIDLIKRHHRAMKGENVLDFNVTKSAYNSLLAQAHQIGTEKYLIAGSDKTLWYHELWSRYKVQHSNQLDQKQLADFVAYLTGYEPNVVGKTA